MRVVIIIVIIIMTNKNGMRYEMKEKCKKIYIYLIRNKVLKGSEVSRFFIIMLMTTMIGDGDGKYTE